MMESSFLTIWKAASRKYLRRVRTGNPKRPWRYIYQESSKKQKAPLIQESDSPLSYNTSSKVKRLSLNDSGEKAPQEFGKYFSEGSSSIAFLDYSLFDNGDRVFIHFIKTRPDKTGQGAARLLVDKLYSKFSNKKEVNWGKLTHESAENLFEDKKSEGKIPTFGKYF